MTFILCFSSSRGKHLNPVKVRWSFPYLSGLGLSCNVCGSAHPSCPRTCLVSMPITSTDTMAPEAAGLPQSMRFSDTANSHAHLGEVFWAFPQRVLLCHDSSARKESFRAYFLKIHLCLFSHPFLPLQSWKNILSVTHRPEAPSVDPKYRSFSIWCQ